MYKKTPIIKKVIASLKNGDQLGVSCFKAGVKPGTFWIWRKNDERLDRVVIAAQEKSSTKRIEMVVDANFKSALAGNVVAQCFFLKNKAGWKDVEPAQVNVYNQIWNGAIAKSNKVSDTGRLIGA